MRGKPIFCGRWIIVGYLLIVPLILICRSASGQVKPAPWRVGLATWSTATTPFWIASDTGLFRRRGLEVELIHIAGDTRTMQTVLAGQVHLGVGSATSPLRARLGGTKVQIVGAASNSMHHYIISKRELTSPEQLRGKKIGIAVLGGGSHLSMLLALDRLNIPATKVTFLQVGNTPERFAALVGGSVDATIVSPPFTLIAQQQGFRLLVPLKDLGISWLPTAIYGLDSTLKAYPEAVHVFLESIIEGIHTMKSDRPRTEQIIQRHMRFSKKEELADAYERYAHELTTRDLRPSIDGVKTMLNIIAQDTAKAAYADPQDFVEMRFLENIYRSGFLQELYGQR